MATRIETLDGEDYEVRSVTGSAATSSYRCPGCNQLIRPATPHIVAWPVVPSLLTSFSGTGVDERRHWHTACWQRRRTG
ncbi:MAG: hypothetical protein JWR35_2451 [Marmoricola sp.]|jgi:hypothetical protein|nr:hypothetical protein [Marmoricola sp.]